MGESIAGVIIDLALAGAANVASAANRVGVNLSAIEGAAQAAGRAATAATEATLRVAGAARDVEQRISISAGRVFDLAHRLERFVKANAEAIDGASRFLGAGGTPGLTKGLETTELVLNAGTRALSNASLTAALAGPQAGAAVGLGSFAVELFEGVYNRAKKEKEAREALAVANNRMKDEIDRRERESRIAAKRGRDDFIERQIEDSMHLAKLNASLSAGMPE